MQALLKNLQKCEFEARIFVSLAIAAGVCGSVIAFFATAPSILVLLGSLAGMPSEIARALGFILVATVMAGASVFRMWAGSLLTPHRVMAFKVQTDVLKTSGPYRIVRNPIYLADFIALSSIALCFPPVGILIPVLFYLHYQSIIRYEEVSLRERFGTAYDKYSERVPRLIPSISSLKNGASALREFDISREGIRHNALFVLFVPGFLLAALKDDFMVAVFVGLPAVIDWAVVHTKIGTKRLNAGGV